MSSKLALPIVENIDNGDLIHITDDLSEVSQDRLRCPICLGGAHFRKEGKKVKHFAHNPNVSCSADGETLLHQLAKMYVHHMLSKRMEFPIQVSTNTLRDEGIRSIYESLGIRDFTISSERLLPKDIKEALLEKKFFDIVPDVSVINVVGNLAFAFEIKVSHEVDEEKERKFEKHNIGYIEITPIDFYISKRFQLTQYAGIDFLEMDRRLIEMLFAEKQEEIYRAKKPQLQRELSTKAIENEVALRMKKITKLSKDELIDNVQKKLTSSKKFISPQISKYFTTTFNFSRDRAMSKFFTTEPEKGGGVESISVQKDSVLINRKYVVENNHNAIASLVRAFAENGYIKLLLGQSRTPIGFLLNSPDIKTDSDINEELIFFGEDNTVLNAVEVSRCESMHDYGQDRRLYMQASDGCGYQISEVRTALRDILTFLKSNYRLTFFLSSERAVCCFEAIGFPNEKALKKHIGSIIRKNMDLSCTFLEEDNKDNMTLF